MSKPISAEERLVEFIAQDSMDPLAFVKTAYPWGKGELKDSSGPRDWQAEELDNLGKHLRNPKTRFMPYLLAVASGHGVGKSGLISMICHWGMSTCADTKIVITANTERQLATKTMPEVGTWFRRGINAHWFKTTATAVYAVDKEHERTWRLDAIPWSDTNTESFAGLHNKGRRIIVIFDEGSAIADKIWEVVEGALTDENTEIIWIAFGNPTRNSGRFRECFGRYAHLWKTRQVDSRTVDGTNKVQLQQWVDTYGEDSDFVRVRVRGVFPRAGSMQFIPSDLVDAARLREPEAKLYDPLVLGVDVARFGDDSTILCTRRGRDAKSVPWETMRGADTMQVAARVMALHDRYKFDAIFVDGGGVGGGVIDRLRMMHYPVIEVQFGASADRSQMTGEGDILYANKRAEMWGSMRDWLKGGMIPDDPELISELSAVEYGYVMREGVDKILLEKKSDMKKRGLASPDKADALCFVAGTMIRTPKGNIPIEDLEIDDEVITPFGVSKVKIKWVSETESLTSAKFSNGSILCGKGAHKIFTWKTGYTALDALALTDVVSVYGQEKWLWQIMSALCTMGCSIQFKLKVDTILHGQQSVTALAFFIGGFGQIITDKYRQAMTSITKTITGVTTIFQTLNVSKQVCIVDGICLNGTHKGKCSHRQEELCKKQQNGTPLQKELNGTKTTLRDNGKSRKQKLSCAKHVMGLMKHIWEIPNTVLILVCKKLHINVILPKNDHVASVGISSKQTDIEPLNVAQERVPIKNEEEKKSNFVLKNLVNTAVNIFSRLLNGQKKNIVPVDVQSEVVSPTKVYNLTLEKHNAYYANDILAYNCLTFAYPVMPSDHRGAFERADKSQHQISYNPFSRQNLQQDFGSGMSQHKVDYNPFGRK